MSRTAEAMPDSQLPLIAYTQARMPAYKLTVHFGEPIGTRRSSSQLVANYSPERDVPSGARLY